MNNGNPNSTLKPENNPKELMRLAKNGDREAFGLLYESYFTPVFHYVYFRVKNKEIAQDLVQSVFLKVYQNISYFQEKNKSPLAYFLTVARNTIFDHWRRKKEIVFGDIEKDLYQIPDNEKSPWAGVQKNETKDLVQQAIKSLSDEQKEIIVLKFINDLSNREIAQITGKSEEAIRQLQCRALKTLRQQFKELKII